MPFRFRATIRTPLADKMVSTRELGIVAVELHTRSTVRGTLDLEIRPLDGSQPTTVLYAHVDDRTAAQLVFTPNSIEIPCLSMIDRRNRAGTLILKPVEDAA